MDEIKAVQASDLGSVISEKGESPRNEIYLREERKR